MTAKDKANQLVTKFIKHSKGDKETKPIQSAKQCALICVDEILNLDSGDTIDEDYWQEVKTEIEKL